MRVAEIPVLIPLYDEAILSTDKSNSPCWLLVILGAVIFAEAVGLSDTFRPDIAKFEPEPLASVEFDPIFHRDSLTISFLPFFTISLDHSNHYLPDLPCR